MIIRMSSNFHLANVGVRLLVFILVHLVKKVCTLVIFDLVLVQIVLSPLLNCFGLEFSHTAILNLLI